MDEHHLRDPTRRPQVVSMEEMHDLAHDIEDCIDRFLPCAACGGKQPPSSTASRRRSPATDPGTLWLMGIAGSITYNWSRPGMKTSVKLIHTRSVCSVGGRGIAVNCAFHLH